MREREERQDDGPGMLSTAVLTGGTSPRGRGSAATTMIGGIETL